MMTVTKLIGAGRLLLLTFTVALFIARPVAAATVRNLEVTYDNGAYLVTFDVLLTAEAPRVWALLSDHTQWPRLSTQIKDAHLLETFPDGRERVNLGFRSCVLIFCKSIRQVKDVAKLPNGGMVTRVISEDSDFSSGWEHWRVVAEGNQTRVHYRAALVPNHRVLPFLGRWVVASHLRRMLRAAAARLEVLAATVETNPSPTGGTSS